MRFTGRVLPLLLIAVLLTVSIGTPTAAAPSDVSIYQVEDAQSLDAGFSTSFEWVVFNNGTTPQLITPQLLQSLPSRMSYEFTPTHLVLEAGEGAEILLNITAARDMYSERFDLDVKFTITGMSLLAEREETLSVTLDVRSIFGDLDRENKVLGIWDNFLPPPFDDNWGAFLVSILIWVGLAYLVLRVLRPALKRATKRTETAWDDIIIDVVRQPLFLFLLVYGTVSSLEILALDPSTVADLEFAYLMALVVIGALLVYRLLVRVLVTYGRQRSKDTDSDLDDTLVNTVEMLGKIVVPIGAAFVIASIIGMDLGGAILGLGFLGLVIGYATQSSLSNLFAGAQLMIDRPFRPGDRVPLDDGHSAEVIKVGLRATTLHDIDTNERVIIPNSMIESQVIVNMSAPDIRWKSSVKVRVSSKEDPRRIEELMMEASRRTSEILQGAQAPVVRLSSLNDGRLLFTIFIWVDSVYNRHQARTEYRKNLIQVFKENSVEFALPRRTVWLNRE